MVVRSPNRSASEIQDLLTGSRTVHMAVADYVSRFGGNTVGKNGLSRVGIAASATAGDSVKMLRAKYPKLFMIVDGLEMTGANAKNASYGFNKLGHGAIVCAGSSVTGAWKEAEYKDMDFVQVSVEAARKVQKKSGDMSAYFRATPHNRICGPRRIFCPIMRCCLRLFSGM